MEELVKLIKVKFTNFDITPQHLGKIIRDNTPNLDFLDTFY